MRKADAIALLKKNINNLLFLYENKSEDRMDNFVERHTENLMWFFETILKMRPPSLPSDHCQALMSVYVGADFNQWEEDFEKDDAAMAKLKARQEYAALTPLQRAQRYEESRAKLAAMREESKQKMRKFCESLRTPRKKRKRRKKK